MLRPMHATARAAAQSMRACLARHGPAPATFWAALNEIPERDREAWVDLVWDIDELPDDDPGLPRGCVPYLPCPVTTVLEAVQQAAVTCNDVFVDIGSGLGRAALLAHLLTGSGCIGLEIQPGLVQAARARAAWLNLHRMRFIEGDAVDLVRFMTIGTVFFLYCPFGADRLRRVLDDLESIALTRPIRVCSIGLPALDRPWLAPMAPTSVDLTVYRSTHRLAAPVKLP